MIHTVKGISTINEADFFFLVGGVGFPCFFHDPMNAGNLISGSSASLKPSLYIWKFSDHILLKPCLKGFEHYFASKWNECNCMVVWHSLALLFLGIGMKTDLFQSCGYWWVFQICWCIECSTLTASSVRILNSLARIPSPPLALFVVMLPKAHLTLHCRMSDSRWVTTPLWLSRSLRPFLYSSFVYS